MSFAGRLRDDAAMTDNAAMRESKTDQAGRFFWRMPSPVGPLLLVGGDDCLREISFPTGRGARQPRPGWIENRAAFGETIRQIDAYFAGGLTRFDLPLAPQGDAFQQAVWAQLLAIPYGETATYGEVAVAIGQPVAASRAVGVACGQNPLPVVIACHRVVGAGGALVGFGGGLETKKHLLDLEFRVRPPSGTLFAAASGGRQ